MEYKEEDFLTLLKSAINVLQQKGKLSLDEACLAGSTIKEKPVGYLNTLMALVVNGHNTGPFTLEDSVKIATFIALHNKEHEKK